MARRLAASLPGGTLAAARDATTANTITTLAAYRKHCASNSSAVQLILPEALKLLPLYALALLKGPPLRVRRCGEWQGARVALSYGWLPLSLSRAPGGARRALFPPCSSLQEGVKPDDRSLWISQMMSLPAARISPLMYPRLLPLRKTLEGLEPMEELPDGVVSRAALLPLA